eukprot:2724147-Prymnesium_polylepis.1
MSREPALEVGECPLTRHRSQVRRVTHTRTVRYHAAVKSPPCSARRVLAGRRALVCAGRPRDPWAVCLFVCSWFGIQALWPIWFMVRRKAVLDRYAALRCLWLARGRYR